MRKRAPMPVPSLSERSAGLLSRPDEPGRSGARQPASARLAGLRAHRTDEPTGRNPVSGRVISGPLAARRRSAGTWLSRLAGLGSIFEMDDIHRTALLHPGPVVIPAALAFGRCGGNRNFLEAIIAGYEAMIRIGAALVRRTMHSSTTRATCGGFGAAAAAGRMLGLETGKQMVSALGMPGALQAASGNAATSR